MNPEEIVIGLRVRIKSNDMTALVVGPPEYYTPRSMLVRIKYENSTRYEYMIHTQIESLPLEEQYEGLGGKHRRTTKSI